MNIYFKKFSTYSVFTLPIFIFSCASIGNKTLYNSIGEQSKIEIDKILLLKPDQINIDFYKGSAVNFYFDELERIFMKYNISFIKSDTFISDFEGIQPGIKIDIPEVENCDIILAGQIERLIIMGQTKNYKVEYKLISSKDKKLIYHSKYSTAFGKTYVVVPGVGLPSEEQLLRDAIKLGLYNIEKEVLNK